MKIGNYTQQVSVYKLKDTEENGKGFIQFGTEVVNSEDHSVIALLVNHQELLLQFQLH